jgi:NhaP-type Na+/H+ or K+/H+ antiporter
MHPAASTVFSDPALTIASALAAGMLAQSLARHLRIPGIVLLLAAGVLLGPDLLGIVRPDSLGPGLQILVGYAVAIVLFEGGMNLEIRRLRRSARGIRQLVTIGALVTATGGAISARLLLGWSWTLSVLFGTLVIVTGPTVVTPLLRRLRLKSRLATVLEAEGVLIDAIGALMAVVTLEAVLHPAAEGFFEGAESFVVRLGLGAFVGLAAGLVMVALLRHEWLVPEGLENVLVLSIVLALFQGSNALLPESGLVSVTIAGLVVGNFKARLLADLRDFKEQLTVLMIGMLFVLLAADVRLSEVRALGLAGALTVASLMFVVRPLNVLISTAGSALDRKEKLFIAWLAPRGIVAAAVSSLFAQELTAAGIEGGKELRALVFLVIAATVLVQGMTGGLLAQVLGLRRPTNAGFLILGANPLGLALGRVFRAHDEEVVFIDSSPDACREAEEAGFRVLFGSALAESILIRAQVDGRAGSLAVTANDEVNLLFGKKTREEYKVQQAWVALRSGHKGVTPEMVEEDGAKVLFGEPRNLDLWMIRIERGLGEHQRWFRRATGDRTAAEEASALPESDDIVLPLAIVRGRTVMPIVDDIVFKRRDELHVLVNRERAAEATAWMEEAGWEPWRESEGTADWMQEGSPRTSRANGSRQSRQ